MQKLLGEYLRANCNLTCHQIVLGLRQQVIMRDEGTRVPLGEVLISLGFITEQELFFALEQQRFDVEMRREIAVPPDPDRYVYLQE